MNAEAEEKIAILLETRFMPEVSQSLGNDVGAINIGPAAHERAKLIAAIRWAYQDAARVCMEHATVEGIAQKCAQAIEDRAR